MRIAIVTSTFKPELSGIAETLHKRVRELSRQGGHEILVLGPDYSAVAAELPDWERWVGDICPGVRVETYPTGAYSTAVQKADTRRILPFWRHSLDERLAAFKPELVHVDEPDRLFGLQLTDGYMRRVGVRYARARGIPVTGMWHTDYIKYAAVYLSPWRQKVLVPIAVRLMAWIYRAYDVAICNSEEARGYMERIGVHNARFLRSVGIDGENFRPMNLAADPQRVRLLYVGRVTPEKSLPVLLDAFLQVAGRRPEVELRVVGDGPSLAELRGRYQHPRLRFEGKIENARLPEVYNQADLFINPSHTETFTQTALEAAACGLPILVARGGGNFETVREGVNGEFFSPGATAELAEKIETLAANPELRRTYAASSPALAAPFSIAEVVRGFLGLWEELRAGSAR